MQGEYINISGNSLLTIIQAFRAIIDNRDRDTFSQLNSFIYERMGAAYDNDNLRGFEGFSAVFVLYYEYALSRLNISITNKDIYDACRDSAPRSLKEKAVYGFRYLLREEPFDLADQQKTNRYGRVVINRFGELINVCLRNNGINGLPDILNQLDQVSDRYNYELNNLKWEIQLRRQEKTTGKLRQELEQMQVRFEAESYINKAVQFTMKATLFWSFFLYDSKIISFDELLTILETFDAYKGYIYSDFSEDLIAMRNLNSDKEFVWAEWDYMKRPDGQAYSPPSVSHWVTMGSTIYMLRNELNLSIEMNQKDPKAINSYEYLVTTMQEMLSSLRESGYENWASVINASSKKNFDSRIEQAERRLLQLRNLAITNKEKQIAELPIDPGYTENFIKVMRDGWENGNPIRELFDHFGKISFINDNDQEHKLFQVGYPRNVWSKTSLIRDNNFHIPVIGIERHGQGVADSEQNLFLRTVLSAKRTKVKEPFSEIEKVMQEISFRGYQPSVILVGLELWYQYFRDLKSPDFVFDWDDKQGYPFSDFGGVYKGVPVVKLRSPLMKHHIIVSDFKESFLLEQKKIKGAYKDILKADINPISEEKAKEMIEKNPAYWKRDMSADDAIIKLRNSVVVDLYLLENFIINIEDAFAVIDLKSEISDSLH